ncbi:hypothetical protein ACFLQG_00700 [Candidatus Zixiibacteriota bacterium]
MYKNSKLLLLLALVAMSSIVYFGCEQPDDVLTSISRSEVYLTEERLPDNPEGMLYEVWVSNASESVSLGKFGYDFETRTYYDAQGNIKADSNKFLLNSDIDLYEMIFVSVENDPDDSVSTPGPKMLIDYLTSPTIQLRFPNVDSMWDGTVRYSMETPSDGNNPTYDGYGLWFASYQEVTEAFNDTFLIGGVLDWTLDSGTYVNSQNCVESNVIYGLESIHQKDTSLVFGLDTLTHSVVRFNVIESTKTCDYYPTQLTINYNVSAGAVTYDQFLQDNFALPDISEFGWKYKGWIISTYIDSMLTNKITLPSWIIYGDLFDQSTGGMLTTGTFTDITDADDDNPYIANPTNPRVPDFPGEDFFNNLPGGMAPINFVPSQTGNPGMVIISVEPDNYNSTTNFPLIAFIDDALPQQRSFVTNTDIFQMFTMRGWMFSNDPYRGFPKISVEIIKY